MAYQDAEQKFKEAFEAAGKDTPRYTVGNSLYELIYNAIEQNVLKGAADIESAFILAHNISEQEDNLSKKNNKEAEMHLLRSYIKFYNCFDFNQILGFDFRYELHEALGKTPYVKEHYGADLERMANHFRQGSPSRSGIENDLVNDFARGSKATMAKRSLRESMLITEQTEKVNSVKGSQDSKKMIDPTQVKPIVPSVMQREKEAEKEATRVISIQDLPIYVSGSSLEGEKEENTVISNEMGHGSPSDQVLPASVSAKELEGEKEKEVVVKMSQKSADGSASVVQPMANGYPIVPVTNYPVSLTEEVRANAAGLGIEGGFSALKKDLYRNGDFNGKKTRWLFNSKVIDLFLECIKGSVTEEDGIKRLQDLEKESFQGADEIKAKEQLFTASLHNLQQMCKGVSVDALDDKQIIEKLLAIQGFSENAFLQLCFDYPQNAFGISPLVLKSKTDDKFNGTVLNMAVKLGTICVANDLIRLSGVGHSIEVADVFGRVWGAIPGSVFSRGTTHPSGGIVGLSACASNQLLQALMDYDLDSDSSLEVYGISLLDADGSFIKDSLDGAIIKAQAEEARALENLLCAQDAFFKNFAREDNQLIAMGNLIEAHLLKKGDTEESLPKLQVNAPIPTLNMAMATILYRDLPRILSSGESIRNFPGLIDAMLWCGDPELSQALKQALRPIINKNYQEFEYMLEIYGSGDDTADLAQAYFDAGENEQLKKQYADRLFEAAQISCGEVLKKCEQYKIDNPSVQQLKDIHVDEMTVEGKFENALKIKLLVKKIKNDKDYKAEQDVENKKESCKNRLNQIFKYSLKNINEDNLKNSNASLVLDYMDSIKDKLDSCSVEDLDKLDKVLATFQDYHDFLTQICSATFDENSPVSKSLRDGFIGMIAELVKKSGVNSESPVDLDQVVKFLNFWKDAQPKKQGQPITIRNFTSDEGQYNFRINMDYVDAYPKALELFEAVIEIYNKYNIVFQLDGQNEAMQEQNKVMQGFIAGINDVAAQAKGGPEILKFLAEVLYEESLRLGQWMEQPGNTLFSAPSNCNEILVAFYHKKRSTLEAVVGANEDLQWDETIQSTIEDLGQRLAQPPYEINDLLSTIALLGALEEQIKILTAMKDGACQESLAKLKGDGAENSGDRLQIIQKRTEVLRDISASLHFEAKKGALRNAFTAVQSIWPQLLLGEINKWLGVNYAQGWNPDSIAENEKNIEVFEKYTAILDDEIADISRDPQDKMLPELKELGLVVKAHFLAIELKTYSIEYVNLVDLKRYIFESFGGGLSGVKSLMQNINEYQTNVGQKQKKFNEACTNALSANLQIVALYKKISGATDKDPIVIQMTKLRVSTKKEIEGGADMGIATAEGLHKINLALINCTSQLKEKMPEEPYERALAVNVRIVSLYREVSHVGEDNIVVKQMDLLQHETKNAVKRKIITSTAAAEILHNVNLELMNCTNFIAVPRGDFKPVTDRQYWKKIGNESMKAVDSPQKRLASKILFGVGCVLAVGFLVGLGVVTAGIGPAIIAAVGLGVAIAVPSTIATAATGAVIGSGLLDRSCNKDMAPHKAGVQQINSAENELRHAIAAAAAVSIPQGQEMVVGVDGDGNLNVVSVEVPQDGLVAQRLGSQSVDGKDSKIEEEDASNAATAENEDGNTTDAERRVDNKDLLSNDDNVELLSESDNSESDNSESDNSESDNEEQPVISRVVAAVSQPVPDPLLESDAPNTINTKIGTGSNHENSSSRHLRRSSSTPFWSTKDEVVSEHLEKGPTVQHNSCT